LTGGKRGRLPHARPLQRTHAHRLGTPGAGGFRTLLPHPGRPAADDASSLHRRRLPGGLHAACRAHLARRAQVDAHPRTGAPGWAHGVGSACSARALAGDALAAGGQSRGAHPLGIPLRAPALSGAGRGRRPPDAHAGRSLLDPREAPDRRSLLRLLAGCLGHRRLLDALRMAGRRRRRHSRPLLRAAGDTGNPLHGCVRMLPAAVSRLYRHIPVGAALLVA